MPGCQRLAEQAFLGVDLLRRDAMTAHQLGDVVVVCRHPEQIQGTRPARQVTGLLGPGQRFSQQLPGRAEVASAETGLCELLFGSREKLGEVIAGRHAADHNAASRRCPAVLAPAAGMRR
jgi:hypothetical protein